MLSGFAGLVADTLIAAADGVSIKLTEEGRMAFEAMFSDRAELADRLDSLRYVATEKKTGSPPLERRTRKMRDRRIIAYDLETTNIAEGTPIPLYLTAFGANFRVSQRIPYDGAFRHLGDALETLLLTPENNGARFVAWNGNRFDVTLIALALLHTGRWIIEPSMTRSKSVRGVRVIEKITRSDSMDIATIARENARKPLKFQFLDGMAMTGLDTVGMPLKRFLDLYAPDYAKLHLDFSATSFDASNPEHIAYAERDAEGLYRALMAADAQMRELTGNGLQTTLGRAAIAYFAQQMPKGVKVWKAPEDVHEILHNQAKRGGYVWIARQYRGPVWKYDLNQAYAAAMRDCDLPCGTLTSASDYRPGLPGLYRVVLRRDEPSPIPVYVKDADTGAARYTRGLRSGVETYLLSNEINHLLCDQWRIDFIHGWFWESSFNMRVMVDNLERLRFSDPLGPNGPLGIMVKTLGNSGYGKTLEKLDGVSYAMALECPGDGWERVNAEEINYVWRKMEEPQEREYHRPQLGCFITAHVRMLVREAALQNPGAFLYADTDCVMFDEPVNYLDLDPRRYGAWKQETDGENYLLIAKKVYSGSGTVHAKGLRTRELTEADMERWISGTPPKQRQLQRNNLLNVMAGAPMFRYLEREGTNVRRSKTVRLDGEIFAPIE